MSGSQLGLAHLYAAARHQEFVEAAEAQRALVMAAAARSGARGGRIERARAIVGALLIGLGERVKGRGGVDTSGVPASSLRLAR